MPSIFLCCCHKSERKDKEWRDLEEGFVATTARGAASTTLWEITPYHLEESQERHTTTMTATRRSRI
jgi:hypothetical protein